MKSLSVALSLAIAVHVGLSASPADASICRIFEVEAVCGGSAVQLDWDSSSMCAGETFDVYRAYGSGSSVLIASGITDTEYLDGGPTRPGVARRYKVVDYCGWCDDTFEAEPDPITYP